MGKGGVGKGGVEARVYVGNLSWDTSWQTLKDHMRLAGDVAHCDVFEELDGRSKGCAVVTYRSPDAAQKAVEELSDTELDGRQIFVREDREPGKGGKGGDPTCRIYVGNLPWTVTWKELKDHFRSAGEVARADVAFEDGMEGGRSKGYGIVEFKSLDSARSAIDNFQETELLGRKILVREDREVVNPLASQISSWQLATVPGKGGFGKGFPGKGGFGGFAPYGAYDAYGGKASGKGKGGDPGCKVFVGNLGYNVSWQDLKDHVRPVGEVLHVEIMTEGGTDGGASKGCGTVEFATYGAARRAVERLHESMLSGRPLLVREFNSTRRRRAG